MSKVSEIIPDDVLRERIANGDTPYSIAKDYNIAPANIVYRMKKLGLYQSAASKERERLAELGIDCSDEYKRLYAGGSGNMVELADFVARTCRDCPYAGSVCMKGFKGISIATADEIKSQDDMSKAINELRDIVEMLDRVNKRTGVKYASAIKLVGANSVEMAAGLTRDKMNANENSGHTISDSACSPANTNGNQFAFSGSTV